MKLVVADKPEVMVPLVAQLPLSEAKLALEKVGLALGEVKTMDYMTSPSSEPVVRSASWWLLVGTAGSVQRVWRRFPLKCDSGVGSDWVQLAPP